MNTVERDGDDFVIPAEMLAKAFYLSEDDIRKGMREGTITSRSERGVNQDAGLWRLTFFFRERACRFIVDEAGAVIKKATFPIRARPRVPFPEHGDTRMIASDTETSQ